MITYVKAEGETGWVMNYEETLEAMNLLECGFEASICNGSWSGSDARVDLSQKGVSPSLPFCK